MTVVTVQEGKIYFIGFTRIYSSHEILSGLHTVIDPINYTSVKLEVVIDLERL